MSFETYSLSVDFSSNLDETLFHAEILDDGTITTELDGVLVEDDVVTVFFNGSLSGPEQTALDAIVAAHPSNLEISDFFTEELLSVLQSVDSALTINEIGGNVIFDIIPEQIDHDILLNFEANEHIDHSAVTLTAGEGIQGGGDITTSRTFDLDINGLVAEVSPDASTDFVAVYDTSVGAHRKVLIDDLPFSGAGETNTASNQGAGGVGVFIQKTGVDFEFKNINAGSSKITITDDGVNDEIDIDVNEGQVDHDALLNFVANEHIDHSAVTLTAGEGLQGGGDITASRTFDLDIDGLVAEASVDGATDFVAVYDASAGGHRKVLLNNLPDTGEINTASNQGTSGVGVFIQKTGVDLEFKNINAGSSKITVTDDGVNDEIDIDVNEAQLDHDALLNFVANEHIDHSTVTLTAGEGIQGGGDITASRTFDLDIDGLVAQVSPDGAADFVAVYDTSAGAHRKVLLNNLPDTGEINTASNQGTAGVGVFVQKSGVDLEFKNINAGSSKITITDDLPNNEIDIDIDEAQIDHDSLLNFVTSEHIDHSTVTLTAGEGLQGGGDITASRTFDLDINGLVTEASVDGATDFVAVYDTSAGGHRKVLLNNLPDTGEINTASNQGAGGVGVFIQKTGLDLEFKNINAGSSKITVTDDGVNDEIDIDVNEGQVDHDALLNFVANEHIDHSTITLTAGEGLSGGGDITASRTFDLDIDGLVAEASVDGATDFVAVYDTSAGGHRKVLLNNLPDTGEINTASNQGASGVGVFIQKTGVDFEFKNINAGSSKITFTDDGVNDEIDIDVNEGQVDHDALLNFVANEHIDHSAVNLTAGEGIQGGGDITASRTFDLDINGLVAEASPDASADFLAVYDTSAGGHRKVLIEDLPISAGETNTASNQGTGGVGVFIQKTGADLEFKNINAGSSKITVTDDGVNDEIDIDVNEGQLDHDALLNFVANEHIDHSTVTFTAGEGISGGGDITASRTFDLDINSLTEDLTPDIDTDFLVTFDQSAGNHKKVLISNLAGGSPQYFSAYDGTGGQTYSTTDITVNISDVHENSGEFSVSSGEITVNTTGIFVMLFHVSCDRTSGGRSDWTFYLEEDTTGTGSSFAEVEGTRGYVYSRQTSQGVGTGGLSLIRNVTASGTLYRVRVVQRSGGGTNVTVADGSSFTIFAPTASVGGGGGSSGPKTTRLGNTWGISGEIKVAAGDLDFINPFFVSQAPGQTSNLVSCRYKINNGTSATISLQRNDVDIPGYTGIVVGMVEGTTDAADVLLADGDKISLVVTAVSGNPLNLSFTVFIEHTV